MNHKDVRMVNTPRQRMKLHNRNKPCKIVNLTFRIPVIHKRTIKSNEYSVMILIALNKDISELAKVDNKRQSITYFPCIRPDR